MGGEHIVLPVRKSEVINEVKLDEIEKIRPNLALDLSVEIRRAKVLKYYGAPDEEYYYSMFTNNVPYSNDLKFMTKSFCDNTGNLRIILDYVELYVTDKCTLRCKYCQAGKQYYRNSEKHEVDVNNIINDYNRMLEVIDWVNKVVIIGGEPFTYSKLDKLLDAIYANPLFKSKVGQVYIVTNGTIIPNDKTLNKISACENIIINISNYCNLSSNINGLVEAFNQYKICYHIQDFKGTIKGWNKAAQLLPENDKLSKRELIDMRHNGCFNSCNIIKNGKFFLCDLLLTINDLRLVPDLDGISINIYDADVKEQLARYLDYHEPLPVACSWCSGCSDEIWNDKCIPAAEQADYPVETNRF